MEPCTDMSSEHYQRERTYSFFLRIKKLKAEGLQIANYLS
jgi:hypothetical protein